jgi:hypothetical protein
MRKPPPQPPKPTFAPLVVREAILTFWSFNDFGMGLAEPITSVRVLEDLLGSFFAGDN